MDDMEEYCLRYQGQLYCHKTIPDDLSKYPFVIKSDKDTMAIVAVNPKRGYVLLPNGMKTGLSSLEDLMEEYRGKIPFGAWEWADDLLQKEIKAQERKRTKGFRDIGK